MVKPSDFILTTDFATFKNDAIGQFTLTIPGSLVVLPNTFYSTSSSFDIGTAGAPARTYINSSAFPSKWFFGPALQILATGNDSISGSVTYQCFIVISRTSPTTVTATAYIPGNTTGPGILTTEPTARTITIKAATFIPPFAS